MFKKSLIFFLHSIFSGVLIPSVASAWEPALFQWFVLEIRIKTACVYSLSGKNVFEKIQSIPILIF